MSQMEQYQHPYPPVQQVAPKNPAIALLAAFFIPGLGSMMNGQVGKGVGILIGYVVSWFLTIILIGFVGLVGFWVWGMVDAYQGAKKWNAQHGILS
jgi:TM2 domain-containing membrane protein YozV